MKFKNLYDNVWAAFLGSKSRFQNRQIIMPSKFVPISENEDYEVDTRRTNYGTFIYNGEVFDLCYATLTKAGTIIDIIENIHVIGPKPESALAQELIKAGFCNNVSINKHK